MNLYKSLQLVVGLSLVLGSITVEAEMTSTTALEKSSELIELGRKLFNDPRLSGNQKIFCAQCHNLKLGGADPRGISPTVDGKPLRRNAPTVYNAVFNFRQTWDGHARTLKEQAAGVITNPLEMGGSGIALLKGSATTPRCAHHSRNYLRPVSQRRVLPQQSQPLKRR